VQRGLILHKITMLFFDEEIVYGVIKIKKDETIEKYKKEK
jgi:hypothetical protein